MAVALEIQNIGSVLADLDWLSLDTFESTGGQVRQLGRGRDAKWHKIWGNKRGAFVAFATKADAKRSPVAAALLVSQVLDEPEYILLVQAGNHEYWLLAVEQGLPAPRMDRVADRGTVRSLLTDYFNTKKTDDVAAIPIYTDADEILEELHFTQLSRRMFSLDVLGHSLKKRGISHARFSRFHAKPIGLVLALPLLALALGGYVLYQQLTEAETRRAAAEKARLEQVRRVQDSTRQVLTALNALPPVQGSVSSLMTTLRALPMHVHGWRLEAAVCTVQDCMLRYRAESFATWSGYLSHKPATWPQPVFNSQLDLVQQPLPTSLAAGAPRSIAALPSVQSLLLSLGDLAQKSKSTGADLAFMTPGEPISSVSAAVKVPNKVRFTLKGKTYLLESLAQRLPLLSGFSSLDVSITPDQSTFILKGEAYAAP